MTEDHDKMANPVFLFRRFRIKKLNHYAIFSKSNNKKVSGIDLINQHMTDEENKEKRRLRMAVIFGPSLFVILMYFVFWHDYGTAEKNYSKRLEQHQKILAEIAKK